MGKRERPTGAHGGDSGLFFVHSFLSVFFFVLLLFFLVVFFFFFFLKGFSFFFFFVRYVGLLSRSNCTRPQSVRAVMCEAEVQRRH